MNANDSGTHLLTITEAAAYLNVSKATIRRWTNDGSLPCARIGVRAERRFKQADLDTMVQNQRGDHSKAPANQPFAGDSLNHCCILSHDAQEAWSAMEAEVIQQLKCGGQVIMIDDPNRRAHFEAALKKHKLEQEPLIANHTLRIVAVDDS